MQSAKEMQQLNIQYQEDNRINEFLKKKVSSNEAKLEEDEKEEADEVQASMITLSNIVVKVESASSSQGQLSERSQLFKNAKKEDAKLEDFKLLRLVGKGTFGKVYLVEH